MIACAKVLAFAVMPTFVSVAAGSRARALSTVSRQIARLLARSDSSGSCGLVRSRCCVIAAMDSS